MASSHLFDDGVARLLVVGGEVEQRRHGVLLRLLCVRAEQRDERLDGTCLGEGDLVVDVVARERLERGRRVLLRALRNGREQRAASKGCRYGHEQGMLGGAWRVGVY